MGWRIRRAYRGLGEHLCLVDATRGRHLRRREAQSGPAGEALHAATAKLQQAQPALNEQRRALANETRRAERGLDRYYSAFEAGHLEATRFEQRVSALEARLDALREQDADLAGQIAPQGATSPEPADLAAVADNLETTIATADPRQAKALLRLLIKHLRVNGRREILPTYRIVTDTVCALPSSVVLTGHLSNPPEPLARLLEFVGSRKLA
jgi:chromosome segregation ATPase